MGPLIALLRSEPEQRDEQHEILEKDLLHVESLLKDRFFGGVRFWGQFESETIMPSSIFDFNLSCFNVRRRRSVTHMSMKKKNGYGSKHEPLEKSI